MGVLDHTCKYVMSFGQLEKFKGAFDFKISPGIHVWYSTDPMRTVGMALEREQEQELKLIMSHCYQVFGTVSDRSPLGAEAEALIV